ncbi:MAG TPA: chloride channel protein [Algoriphagus sp.]|uniref:voltage-gated chloride channel family protein n=1 Tax=Algoriphagus sp. TaxID=1872435 RepID=UPI000C617107|nr:voltage-gated chloride channel family protein [Algoriphagus sp.]QYH40759.1 voltage-gated chloride channel family protein [Algoriphagus sp. NBT04N3]MAL14818.1 chloride channel protein [Algoriphagus sp.]MAN89103.1 chloride channel protein [Algoriphagus sp.]HAD52001.1 chloride channel protein [Algoriphagus sp.]HAS57143.1 chloride channel protein [Algoriphagus sp.]
MDYSKLLKYFLLWLVLGLLVGLLSGSASAFFLVALDWATNFREEHLLVIALLPLGGWIIGWTYYKIGQNSVKGNNLLLDELYQTKNPIPLRMTPLVLFGTIFTHFFGGSAGREGTAVQMGGSLADQLTKWFKLESADRRLILISGVSGGFASVFGTPLAGAIFALEWMHTGHFRWKSIFPAFWAGLVAHWVCESLWGVGHTIYQIPEVATHTLMNLLWIIPAGIVFGLSGRLFAETSHFFSKVFSQTISYPPLRPFIGGLLIALFVWISGSTTYLGLGVPRIVEAFETPLPWYDWLAKTGLTGFTLGAGFKGGEVTPLFFTGATLGNALHGLIPLPLALLAGMGFVAVFSGATNTPMACTVMGIELFGYESGIFLAIACFIAYIFSGKGGIYTSQELGWKKAWPY